LPLAEQSIYRKFKSVKYTRSSSLHQKISILGTDIAGEVAEVEEGVAELNVGVWVYVYVF